MSGGGTDRTDKSQSGVDDILDASRATTAINRLLWTEPAEIYEIFARTFNNIFIVEKTPLAAVYVASSESIFEFCGLDALR